MASGGRAIDRRAVLMRCFRASMVSDVEKGEEEGGEFVGRWEFIGCKSSKWRKVRARSG